MILRATLVVFLLACTWCVMRLPSEIEQARDVAQKEIVETRLALIKEIQAMRRDVKSELDQTITLLDRHLTKIDEVRVTEFRDEVALIRSDISNSLDHVNESLDHVNELVDNTNHAVELLTPQTLGLVAAAKVTAGETAQAMREVPAIVGNVKQTTANVTQITKPSRWYVKIGRMIAPVFGGWLLGKL